MIVTVNSQRLAAELRLLNRIVPSKPVIPILSHALMETSGEGLSLRTTDLEVSLTTSCAAHVQEQGSAALPAAKLLQMVEQFPDADVSLSQEKDKTLVVCGAFRSRLQAMSVMDFPAQPEVEGVTVSLSTAVLSLLIERSRYAVVPSGAKHVLQGALLTMQGPAAAMVATDGKRLTITTAGRSGPDLSTILPMKTMDALQDQLSGATVGGATGDVEMTVGPRHLFFSFGDRLLVSRTIEGKFPQYERIVPQGNDKELSVDRSRLAAALRRVNLVAEENGAVLFNVTSDGDGAVLSLSSASAGVGSADESLPVQYEGAPVKVVMRGDYVLDFLDVASHPSVLMRLKDASSPALFLDGEDHVSVIMTMR